jgi:fructooligosaccharide transport system substrate-binding protein
LTKSIRALGAAACVALALTAAACSSSGSSSATGASAACPNGVTTLTVLRGQSDDPTNAQLDAYEATNKCVKFSVTELAFNQYLAKLPLELASSTPPDIYDVDSPTVAAYESKGVLAPLDQYLPSNWSTDLDPADLEETRISGKVYAIPMAQVGLALFYNKKLTDAAHITVPTTLATAWTWPQAKAAMLKCQQVAGGAVQGLAPNLFAASVSNNSYRDLGFLRSAGNPKASPASSAYKTFAGISADQKSVEGYVNSPEDIQAATFYQDLFNGPTKVSSATIVQNSFVDGDACFDIDLAGVIGPFSALKFPAGVSPVPYFTTPIIHTGTIDIGVSTNSKHKAIAAKAVVAMATGKLALQTAKAQQAIWPLKSITDQSPWVKAQPDALTLQELLAWGKPRPINAHYDQYDLYMGTALHDIMDGTSPTTALNNAASQIDAVLSSSS